MGDIEKSLKKEEVVDFETVEMEGLEKDIMSLEHTPGWKGVLKELQSQVDSLESQIFDIDNGLKDEERMDKLKRRFYLVELINLPKTKRELFTTRKGGNTSNEEL